MARRERLNDAGEGGAYFASPSTHHEFISSGCTLLNCVLGGGWPLGRVSNIVGDKSTGKTLQAIETIANFVRAFPDAQPKYKEYESAFDREYAAALGMPVDKVDFGDDDRGGNTIEAMFKDFEAYLDSRLGKREPGLYVVDSLDAMSDDEELKREISAGSYGAAKAKKISEMFRRIIDKIEKSRTHLMIISQIRDKMDAVAFGEKTQRSGGRALDFYASQVVKLAYTGALRKTSRGVNRVVGVSVKAKCTKNKVGLPFRECSYNIMFGYGIDDLTANVDWLAEVKRLDMIELKNSSSKADLGKYIAEINDMSDADYRKECRYVAKQVRAAWGEIEKGFLPTRRKY